MVKSNYGHWLVPVSAGKVKGLTRRDLGRAQIIKDSLLKRPEEDQGVILQSEWDSRATQSLKN